MSAWSNTGPTGPGSAGAGAADGTADRPRRHACGWGWRPMELAAMILGFIVFWPIGLAILLWKAWSAKGVGPSDRFSFRPPDFGVMARQCGFGDLRKNWESNVGRNWGMTNWTSNWTASSPFGATSTGNRAFDEWRAAELDRLEAERRKLIEAEREFAEHLESLRMARDREEFERFMRERRNRDPNAPTQA